MPAKSIYQQLMTLMIIYVITALTLPQTALSQETPAPPQMFFAVGPEELPSHVTLPESAMLHQNRFVRINFGHLRSGRLTLNLLDGVTFQASLGRRYAHATGGESWVGTLQGFEEGQAILSRHGKALSGVVSTGDRMFKVQHVKNGVHVIAEVSNREPRPEDLPVVASVFDATGESGDITSSADTGGATMVDVLVAYTPRAKNARGGTDGIISLIELAITETNQIYANSQIDAILNLVHTHETSYSESSSMSTDLSNLRSATDSYMNEVHDLREQFGADMVSLIVDRTDYCGIAYLMTSLSSSFASSAFSVVEDGCATGYYSFAHELGHNMGSHHDYDTAAPGEGVFPYSYGYWMYHAPTSDYVYRTVMAYNCPGGCTRMQHFSNPGVSLTYSGDSLPTGIADQADNAFSINNAIGTVAAWRSAATAEPPIGPDGLAATALDHESIDLVWSDNSDNESGFRVERSTDGVSFAEIATAGAGVTTYHDSGLASDTLYSYRVRAYNGAGNSPYSNTESATTEAAPTWVRNHAIGETPVHGSVTGTYLDTTAEDGISQRITESHSGGKPSKRYTWLEHRWTFDLPPANTHALTAVLDSNVSNPESFSLAYSTNGQDWVEMFLLAPGGSVYTAPIPASISGPLYVQVRDNHQVPGIQTDFWVSVDHLYVDSDSTPVDPPGAPENLSATATSSSTIDLAWGAATGSVDSYSIERSPDGSSNWQAVGSVAGSQTDYTDEGLAPETTYHYQVWASNSGGQSATASPGAYATTLAAPSTSLTVTHAGSSRGRQLVDLVWAGLATVNVRVLRNAEEITTTDNDGSYRDTVKKGTYSYQVCETGEPEVCTPVVTATF